MYHISVCVCTYKRPHLLARLLSELRALTTEQFFTYSIVVVDNDILETSRQVTSSFASSTNLDIVYFVEPRRNIARARNKAVVNATGDFIAFIDDDEFPNRDWLITLLKACLETRAAGVLAPVRPYFEKTPPRWVLQGKFCERPSHPSGYALKWRETRTGNVIFRRDLIQNDLEPFRPQFGNGGEDQDFFKRMIQVGHSFVWCEEAAVYESVSPERMRRVYMLRRALLRGQNEEHMLTFRSLSESFVALPIYTLSLPVLFILGHIYFMHYLIRTMDHAGRLMAALGIKPMGKNYLAD